MELDPEARRILDLTREGRTPSMADKARIERLLGSAVGFAAAPALASTSVAPGAKVTAAALALKWGGVTALVAAAALGGIAYWNGRGGPQHGVSPVPVAKVIEPSVVMPTRAEPVPVAAAAPLPEPPAPRRSTEGTRSKDSTLGAELDLLHEVQAKWRGGDANGALALLAVHRERYPHSQLGPEREALRVLCLCATGRTDEARRIGRRFLTNAPRSPLRTSVEESCAGK
jgi:hypothetical protein